MAHTMATKRSLDEGKIRAARKSQRNNSKSIVRQQSNRAHRKSVNEYMQSGQNRGDTRMLWLAAYNPEIDWEKGEVKMTRCPPICGKKKQEIEGKKINRVEEEEDKEMLKKLVPKRFWRWKKVFRKKELSQTSFSYISTNSSTIPTVSKPA